jgi:hypothetical protein
MFRLAVDVELEEEPTFLTPVRDMHTAVCDLVVSRAAKEGKTYEKVA